ncbi:MAG: hypothetical protein ACREBE_06000 [bacterium]
MHKPRPLRFTTFSSARDPLVAIEHEVDSRQVKYLRCYLHDLGARSVVVEPNYFDRDYLSEFEAFYATSASGYPNICERAHYFDSTVTRATFANGVGGNERARKLIEESYLGHIIIRPIPEAPIGRTVLEVYPDDAGIAAGMPRIMEPAREYEAHIAGLTLAVSGVAWQQQDSAVGSCATVGLWSMLHSSAFDDHHAIPTTATITSMAHRSAPMGHRAFPDSGLHLAQILEVIKGHGLAPVMILGDEDHGEFSRQRFCTLVGSFIRSGYPVLVNGWLEEGENGREAHTVCIVGFRSSALPTALSGDYVLADANIDVVYVHDDNLGPNARFRVRDRDGVISLVPESPEPRRGAWPTENPTKTYHEIVPTEMVVAVHQELRTDPVELQRAAHKYAHWLPLALDHELKQQRGRQVPGMIVGSRFLRLRHYVERELASALRARAGKVLSRARLELWEEIAPMSLHVGLVRVSLGLEPMADILFDTSDSDRHLRPTAYVAYQPHVPWLLGRWRKLSGDDIELGKLVRAW